jgi:hypothetical protein
MKLNRFIITTFTMIFIFAVILVSTFETQAQPEEAVIDFEGIDPGTIVDQLTSGFGISGVVIPGYVAVSAYNPDLGDVNAAMIFDATCPPGNVASDCSGGDSDLFNESYGNTLIISEDLDTTDPDDADVAGSRIYFEYSNFGDGNGAYIESLEVQDIEEDQGELEDAKITFFQGGLGGTPVGSVDIPDTGNGVAELVTVDFAGVDAMEVDLAGSGTINNIRFTVEPTAVELLYFNVDRPLDGAVNLTWETAAEIDNLGFYIYRGLTANIGDAERIHFETAGGGSSGHIYSFTDTPGPGSWFYWLSDIDTSGVETFHLPDSQSAGYVHQTFLPFLVGK